jgi:hypothetical protein
MDSNYIIKQLEINKGVFQNLLSGLTKEEYLWKPEPTKWCLLELVCHLHDEEIEDFRTRVRCVLENPEKPLPSFDPGGAVKSRNYIGQNYEEVLSKFSKERDASIEWLRSLSAPNWDNTYQHPSFGPMKAKLFFTNWLVHDYLHIRQAVKLKYDYIAETTKEDLRYAGEW